MKKIFGELSRIQQELKAPKNLFNRFGNYNYRNAEGILEAVKPLLNGMVIIINDEPVLVGDRFYIRATVTLTDGEESISAVAYAREDETKKGMDGCQITGACSSYARKYALNALLMIDDAKDSDDDSLSPKNPANKDDKPRKHEEIPIPENRTTPKAAVETSAAVPAVSPEIAFLKNELGKTALEKKMPMEAVKTTFEIWRKAGIKDGYLPNKKVTEYTLDEIKSAIEYMRKNLEAA